jgi:hypothetical protein
MICPETMIKIFVWIVIINFSLAGVVITIDTIRLIIEEIKK